MRPSTLSVATAALLSSIAWTLATPTSTLANQHAPALTNAVAGSLVEILVERVKGPMRVGQFKTLALHQVPADRNLVITDLQARAGGYGAFLMRDGQRVAEVSHHYPSNVTPTPVARHTTISTGIEFGPGSLVQLQLPPGYQGEFISLRGYYEYNTGNNPQVTIHYPGG